MALVVRVVHMRVVKNMTKNGKYVRFSALVAAGTGAGAVGLGAAKAAAAPDAILRATRAAVRAMAPVPRHEGRTLLHDDVSVLGATEIRARPAAPGAGRRCHHAAAEVAKVAGIADVSADVRGSTNPMNVAKAFLALLRAQRTPEDVARAGGLRLVDVAAVYARGCADQTAVLRAERYSTLPDKRMAAQTP